MAGILPQLEIPACPDPQANPRPLRAPIPGAGETYFDEEEAMTRTQTRCWCASTVALLLVLLAAPLAAQVEPEKLPLVAEKEFRHPDLDIPAFHLEVRQLPATVAAQARGRLERLGVAENAAFVDQRGGRFVTLLPATPLIPGRGVGNELAWSDLRESAPKDAAAAEQATFAAFKSYLEAGRFELGIDPAELGAHRIGGHGDGELYQIYVPRSIDGIPVRGSYLTAVIGQGNLTLFGAEKWGDRPAAVAKDARLGTEEAHRIAADFMAPLQITGEWGKADLEWIPVARGKSANEVPLGKGYGYRLAWSVKVHVEGDGGHWEVLVDAKSGQVLASEDKNAYAEAKGGVYPLSNDGIVPDGVEQAGWPMPWLTITGGTPTPVTTDTGGNASVTGNLTATLSGPYVRMSDSCGAISLTQAGNLDFGASAGTDCTTPGFGGAGNTHSSRSGFYELNKIKEMARGQLPSNTWLNQQLVANMNLNQTCNAFWGGGTVNFYRSGGGCFNTGEIAAVFDHEWGHGLDDNDINGTIASPSGEGIADIYSALRLNDSCIGRHFRSTVCNNNGDPCLTCTGVRDIDYLKRQSGTPHHYTWSNANCLGSVHCVGGVYSEAIWSLWKRKLVSPPYSLDANTAHEVVTRLSYIAGGNIGTWFSGGPPNGGCAATSGYMNYLAADDDNGNLLDGTPHMTAIWQSFNDQQIACGTPAVQDSGCANLPTAAPNVTATPGSNSVGLAWGSVANATKYQVFRTEGVQACNFGKVKLGETTGLAFNDANLQNGRDYSYVVIPIGGHNACMGPASACDTVQPGGVPACTTNAQCDDGLFCNGAETCSGGSCQAGTNPCSGGQTCNETTNACESSPVTVTFTSVAADDGYVIESGENTGVGGSATSNGSNANGLRIGDNNQDRQQKTVVSFNTASLPDGAVITAVTLRLRRGGLTGTNPFTTHGACWADIVSGSFSGSATLQTGDFQAAATATQVASMSNPAANLDWSTGNLNAAGLAAVNKTGLTQLRVYFNTDDNDDNGADYLGFYPGNNGTAANRPQLVVTYLP